MSAQRRTATKRRSNAQRPTPPAARIAPAAEPVVDGAGDVIVEQPAVRRMPATKPPTTTEERARSRAEAKATAREGAEKGSRPGGIVGRVISTERTSGVQKFVRETVAEIKKVNWPDQETTRNLTIVVIGVSIALGLLLGGIDYVLFKVFEAL